MTKQLKRRNRPVAGRDLLSLIPLFAPAVFFLYLLIWGARHHPRLGWLADAARYPWELWAIAICGAVGTLGGLGDWIFHRIYVSVGPREHVSHMLAMGSGGFPLFVLMAVASAVRSPHGYVIPVMVVVLYTTVLICYDEFVFHRVRCGRLETGLHRIFVFGNGLAWLAWAHWCFVRGGAYA